MEKKELDVLFKEFGSKIATDVEAQCKEIDTAWTEGRDEVAAELEKSFNEKYSKVDGLLETMQKQIDRQDNDIKNGLSPNDKIVKSFSEVVNENLKSDKYKEFSKAKKGEFVFNYKASDMTRGSFISGEIPIADQEPGVIGKTPFRQTFMQNIVPVGFTSNYSIAWIDRSAENNDAAVRAEGGAYAQSDVTYTRRTLAMKSLATYYKVSDEMMDDIDFLASEIRSEGVGQMERLLDSQLLTGSGSGNNLTGIQANATAFSAPTGTALQYDDANNYDAIRVAALQASTANYIPDTVILHPTDWELTLATKDSDGSYVIAPGLISAGNVFTYQGLRVVANTGQTQGTIDVFDSTKAKIFIRQNIVVKLWEQNEDDAINGYKTITFVARGNQRISAEHYGAFINGTLSAIKLAINKV